MDLYKLDKVIHQLEEIGMLFAIIAIEGTQIMIEPLYEVVSVDDEVEDTEFLPAYVKSMAEDATKFINNYLEESYDAKYLTFNLLLDTLVEITLGHIDNGSELQQLSYDYITLCILRNKINNYLITFNN